MRILNATGSEVTFVQSGKDGEDVRMRLPRGALIRFRPSGKNHFVVTANDTCSTRSFNDPEALVLLDGLDPCKLTIYCVCDSDASEESA